MLANNQRQLITPPRSLLLSGITFRLSLAVSMITLVWCSFSLLF